MAVTGQARRERLPSEARRTRLTPQARREQLLQIGVDMLADKRLEDLTIDDIASRADISRGLLFHYFSSLQEFQAAVVQQIMDGLVQRLRAAERPDGDPEAGLERSLTIYIDYIAERPDLYRSVVRGASSSHERMREMAAATRDKIVDIILDDVRARGVAAEADDPSIRLGAHAWIAMTEEMVTRWLHDRAIERDELMARLVAPLPGLLGLDP